MEDTLLSLQNENEKLARKVARLEATIDRNKKVAASISSIGSMLSLEQKKQDHYMRTLLENSPDIILLLDATLRFAYCTEAFLKAAEINGFSIINGQRLRDVLYQFADRAWVDAFVDNLKVAYSANESLSFEETLDFTGNDPRIYQVQFTPVKADNAESDSALILMHDITEISETQRQAEEAREAAERASEAKSIFLSNMSHEMRTPLNAILGMTAIAKSAAEPDKINYSLDKIEDASSHLLSVIGDILDASMNETDKMELISVPFSLRGMIQTDVSIIRRYIEEKSQDLAIEIAAEVPETIISDELHLSQVLKNLLMNAIKFTPRRGMISLAVSLADINPTFATIRFVIKDNGIGISAEQQRNLFTPFMQADNSASRKYGGMGLGLAISERIVRRMGGEILVESEQGKGSVFSFTIAANYASDVHVETPDDFSAYRALLAEDVEINREIVHAFLETTGLQIEDAENGKVALDLFERDPERFDIIFMDIQMPEMDGLTATRRIRGLGSVHAKTVPIVAMTANVFQQDIDKCLDAGMNDHIGKPINVKVILSALHKYLRPKTAAK